MTPGQQGGRLRSGASDDASRRLAGAKLLVIGGSGFIGRHLTRWLLAEGATVTAWDRVGPGPGDARLVSRVVDISNLATVEAGFADGPFDATVHLASKGAGIGSVVGAVEDARLTGVVVEAGASRGLTGHLVLFGSSDQYGSSPAPQSTATPTSPINPYGLAKNLGDAVVEHARRRAPVPMSTVRPFSVYGPGQPTRMFLHQLARAIASRTEFRMSAGTQVRDFVHVNDVCEAVVRLLCIGGVSGNILNVGTGQGIRLADAAERLCAAVGADIPIVRGPGVALDDPPTLVADVSEIVEQLGWKPTIDLVAGFRALLTEAYPDPA